MMALSKLNADSVIKLIPAKLADLVLRVAAIAPPALKTRSYERVCTKLLISSMLNRRELIRTNLGISSMLRCELPIGKTSYSFGRPENNLSERSTLALVQELSVDCSHFVDVGAHEGIFTFLVSHHHPGIAIHWFEPDGELCERLAQNLHRNAVHTYGNHAAVAERTGTTRFFKNLSDDLSGSLSDCFTGDQATLVEEICGVRLSDYFRGHDLSSALVKIDVEGTGCEVWSGTSEVSADINYLVMEMLAPEVRNGLPLRIIQEAAFHAYYLRDFELMESLRGEFDYVAPFYNWLFCRLDPDSLTNRLSETQFLVRRAP
jgi:FkbM family methyltransferase